MDERLLSKVRRSVGTPSGTDATARGMLRCEGRHPSGGYACSTGVTIACVALERSAAARAVAGGARQPGAALGAELGVGLGAGTVGGTRGTRDGGRGTRDRRRETRPPSLVPRPRLRAECRQGFRGVLGFERFVVAVREFSRRAIEFDLFQRPERDGLGREVVVGILSLIRALSPVPRPASLRPRTENWLQYEVDPARGEQDPSRELEQAAQEGSRSSSRRRRANSSGVAPAAPTGVGPAAGAAARTQRRSTSVRATPAATISNDGVKYPARLNPRLGGAMRIAMPCSRTN